MTSGIAITGSSGFVGRALVSECATRRLPVVAIVRPDCASGAPNERLIHGLNDSAGLSAAIEGADSIVHLAARAHILDSSGIRDEAEFFRVNVEGSRNIARIAADTGVRRIILVSSIGVFGNKTNGTKFRHDSLECPYDAYTQSKLEAEHVVKDIASGSGLEFCVLRPPLVYGPAPVGNFDRLVRLVNSGVPLPLGGIRNKRSFVSVRNLVDLVLTCVEHPNASNETFLVSDDDDVSTPELIRLVGENLNKPVRLFSVPTSLLRNLARVTSRTYEYERLTASLEVDLEHTRSRLNWNPPVTLRVGLAESIRHSSLKI